MILRTVLDIHANGIGLRITAYFSYELRMGGLLL